MDLEQLKMIIKEAIHEYKNVDPSTSEIAARIEELDWVLDMLEKVETNKDSHLGQNVDIIIY